MMDKLGKSGPFGILVIALVLVLQTVMPHLGTTNPEPGNSTNVHAELAEITKILGGLAGLNDKQCEADKDNATEHKDITEAMILLTASVGQVAHLLDKLETRIHSRGP